MKPLFALMLVFIATTGIDSHQEMITQVKIKRGSGEGGVGMEVRAVAPTSKPMTYRETTAMFLTWNQNVKDAKGRIVTALGFRTWAQNKDARVEVFTLVPRAGAPNQYMARSGRGNLDNLEPVPFAQFTIAVGATRHLDELKTLGLEPLVVTCAKVPKVVR